MSPKLHNSNQMPKFEALANSRPLRFTRSEPNPAFPAQLRPFCREEAVFETDRCGFISEWSSRAEELYGYEADEILGKHIASLYRTTDLMQGNLIYEFQTAEALGKYACFAWQRRADGQSFRSYCRYQANWDKEGKLCGFRKFIVETF
ncbi:MAG: PAS domain-containing protein [Candidatus Obscuribacterales bacterium]|nr:PAS domain-containing protein [Candidatus Obscuribacterales bacterium]